MYPERLKYQYPPPDPSASNNTIIPVPLSPNWSLSLKIKQIVSFYSFLLLMLVFGMAVMWGFPSRTTTAVAWILGILSITLSIFQFIPQIHQTLKHKVKIGF